MQAVNELQLALMPLRHCFGERAHVLKTQCSFAMASQKTVM